MLPVHAASEVELTGVRGQANIEDEGTIAVEGEVESPCGDPGDEARAEERDEQKKQTILPGQFLYSARRMRRCVFSRGGHL